MSQQLHKPDAGTGHASLFPSSSPPSSSSLLLSQSSLVSPHALHSLNSGKLWASRNPLAHFKRCISSTAEYHSEPPSAEVITVMQKDAIHVICDSRRSLSTLQSPFTSSNISLPSSVSTPLKIGSVINDSYPALAQLNAADFEPSLTTHPTEFSQVRISPLGAVSCSGQQAVSCISAAVAAVNSAGRMQIYTQHSQEEWKIRYDMSTYLLRAYIASSWSSLRPFDASSSQPFPRIPNKQEENRRRNLIHINACAWSGTMDQAMMANGSIGNANSRFILCAIGSKGGDVTVWKFDLPFSSADESADASTESSTPPALVCSFSPSDSNTSVFVSQLEFSPHYYDETRGTVVCALAVGLSDGHAAVYSITSASSSEDAAVSASASGNPTAESAASAIATQFSFAATRLLNVTVGSPLMSVTALSWTQSIATAGGSNPGACTLCYEGSHCKRRTSRGTQHGLAVHHFLAIGANKQLHVLALHPDEYLNGTSSDASNASLCRHFMASNAHPTFIHSFVWNVHTNSPFHSSGASFAAPPTATAFASHHVELLSASNDDVVHRWILRDRASDEGQQGLVAVDANSSRDMFSPSMELIPSALPRLVTYPSQKPLRGAHALVRSSDGLQLYTLELYSVGMGPDEKLSEVGVRKRQNMAFITVCPYPFLELLEDEREQFAKLSIAYSTIHTENEEATDQEELNVALKNESMKSESNSATAASLNESRMIDQMRQDELAQRAAEGFGPSPDGVISMDIDAEPPALERPGTPARSSAAPSPVPSNSQAAASASVDTPSKSQAAARRPTRKVTEKKPKQKKAPKKKAKKAKKKRGDADDDEDEDEEWSGSDNGSDDDDGEDDDEYEDDESSYVSSNASDDEEEASRKSKAKRKTASNSAKKLLLSSAKKRSKYAHSNAFANPAQVPVPRVVQVLQLEQQRKLNQQSLLRSKFVPILEERVLSTLFARQVSQKHNRAGLDVSILRVPSALSFQHVHNFLATLSNPFHLSVPLSLSDVATAVTPADSPLNNDKELNSALSVAFTNPVAPFSLYWRYLQRIVPPDLIYGGVDSIYVSEHIDEPIFPSDVFAMPMHRQMPFLFLADSLADFAQQQLEQLLQTQANPSLVSLWLDDFDSKNSADVLQQFRLRFILQLLSIAVGLRSPYVALSIADSRRADTIRTRLSFLLQLQYLRRYLNTYATQTSHTVPSLSILLIADWVLKNILGLVPGISSETEMREVFAHTNAVPTLNLLLQIYAAHAAESTPELQWLRAFLSSVTNPSPSVLADTALRLRDSWVRSSPRESCPLCFKEVRLESSSTGTCSTGHVLPRCSVSLQLLVDPRTLQCSGCRVSSVVSADSENSLCRICWNLAV